MFAVGIWGVFSFISGGSLGGSLSGAMAIGQILITLQVVLGVALVITGARPGNSIHYLYGITIVILLPFAYSYLQRRDPRQALLFFSLAALFIGGLAIRAITTGS
jgi:heme A synthase